jgi:galactose-1-phosphate uridylyltransferase
MSNKKIKQAKAKLDNFSARGSRCPICKKSFRHGCDHSVTEAETRLFENYIKAIAEGK